MIRSLVAETHSKDKRITALDANQRVQSRLFKETSSSYDKKIEECESRIFNLQAQDESRIRNLEAKIRRLEQSSQQQLDAKDQVIHTHNYIRTLLHKQHTHTSHCNRWFDPWLPRPNPRTRGLQPWMIIKGCKHDCLKRPRRQIRTIFKDLRTNLPIKSNRSADSGPSLCFR